MHGVHASSSPAPSPLSTFTGDLLALLPFAYTESPPESPNSSAYEQQLDSSSPRDMFLGESLELVHSYNTAELEGGLRQLPLELRDIIMSYVLDTYQDEGYTFDQGYRSCRERLARLSLVCHSWSHVLRPRLFECLYLKSRDDVHFLDSMLRQPQSGWLSAAVRILHLDVGPGACMGLERVLLVLSRVLPSLQELHYRAWNDELESLSPCLLPSLPRYSSLRTLELQNIKVSSFGLFVKLLSSFPRLEDLRCNSVNWIHRDSVARPPAQIAPFLHLLRITVYDRVSSPWIFLWLFHPMILRRCTPSSIQIENHDIMLMTIISEFVCHLKNEKYRSLNLEYDSGRNELSVRDAFDDPILTFELWPVAPATLNNICSVIRIVEVTLRWDTYLYCDDAEWEAVDTAFAEKATSIEAFNINIEVIHTRGSTGTLLSRVRTHFPRLIERGVVRMRIEDKDGIRHDWRPIHTAHESGLESTSDDSGDLSDLSDPSNVDDLNDPGDPDDADNLDDSELEDRI